MSLFKKNVIIILVLAVLLIALAVSFLVFSKNQASKDLLKVSDSQIISILNKNSDAKDYIQRHADFKISKKEVLTKESIVAGRNGQNFKEVYQGLDLQNNRYIRVDLINSTGDKGLISVIDFEKNQTIKAYELILLSARSNQNGQATSTTTNK